jgi:hypothetical protein
MRTSLSPSWILRPIVSRRLVANKHDRRVLVRKNSEGMMKDAPPVNMPEARYDYSRTAHIV